ncbi:hypothetical protein HDU91_001589 [Kappamyces sp. JEL0680]|nr:hypothetical protein HDU91_001589 [Kappamyces sp. JEL0680]
MSRISAFVFFCFLLVFYFSLGLDMRKMVQNKTLLSHLLQQRDRFNSTLEHLKSLPATAVQVVAVVPAREAAQPLQNHEFWQHVPYGIYYRNISGFLKGWLHSGSPTGPQLAKLDLQVHTMSDVVAGDIYYVEGRMVLEYGQNKFRRFLNGIHFPSNGSVLLSSTLEWEKDYHGLLNKTFADYEGTAQVLSRVVESQVQLLQSEMKRDANASRKFTNPSSGNLKDCAFDVYLQMNGVDARQDDLLALEQELAEKNGYPVMEAPPLTFKTHVLSRPCEYSFSSISVDGMLYPKYLDKVTKAIFFFAIVSLAQLYFTILQTQHVSSPLSRSKMSLFTMLIMSLSDLFHCVFYVGLGLKEPTIFEPCLSVAFLKFIEFAVYDMKLVFTIMVAQNRTAATALTQFQYCNTATDSHLDLAFLLVTYLLFLVFSLSPNNMLFLIFPLYAFWIPQFARNAIRNCKPPLHPWFLWGTTVTRVLTPLYFLLCPFNSTLETNRPLALMFGAYMGGQVLLLWVQETHGGRIALPEVYNYHPVPRDLLVESKECAICFCIIQELDPQSFMLTPCNHLFDTHCLERWMAQRMECPVCRSPLPE